MVEIYKPEKLFRSGSQGVCLLLKNQNMFVVNKSEHMGMVVENVLLLKRHWVGI